ncbi:MAG: hypothetical protein FJ135_02680 [Deltaproteobacteria bacterium]|nr:hypothetical protein [Deltaproteobacteria bacterium]
MRSSGIRLLMAALLVVLLAGSLGAHDCSSPADCEETAGYNAVLAIVGGIMGILASLLGPLLSGATGFLPSGVGWGGQVQESPVVPVGLGPTIKDEYGDPLVNWSPDYEAGRDDYPGRPGDVWYDGRWVDPKDAQKYIDQEIANNKWFEQQQQKFLEECRKSNQDWFRDDLLKLQQDIRDSERAWNELEKVQKYALKHDYPELWEAANKNAINPDGSVNQDYVDKLKNILGNKITRDNLPEEMFQPNFWGDFTSGMWNDTAAGVDYVAHNPFIRIGAGFATGGSSEVFFQSYAAWDAMKEAALGAEAAGQEFGVLDALKVGMKQLGEENLPLNTIQTLADPNASMWDIVSSAALDGFIAVDVMDTFKNVKGSLGLLGEGKWGDALNYQAPSILSDFKKMFEDSMGMDIKLFDSYPEYAPGSSVPFKQLNLGDAVTPGQAGIPPQNAKWLQYLADKYGVDLNFRPTNPDSYKYLVDGYPPKPVDLKMKTISLEDIYLGANGNDLGKVGYFLPELPARPPDMSAAQWNKIMDKYAQRFDEFLDQSHKVELLQGQGKIQVDQNGVVLNTGLNTDPSTQGKAFVGDNDLFSLTDPVNPNGTKISDHVLDNLYHDMKSQGLIEHGDLMSWQPKNPVEQSIMNTILGKNENLVNIGFSGKPIVVGSQQYTGAHQCPPS